MRSGQASPPSPRQTRTDQTRCPRCGAFGCPAVNGTRRTAEGRIAYRQCSDPRCLWLFRTITRDDTQREEVITG